MKTLLAAALLILSTAASAAELSAADLDKRRKALADLLHEQWEYTMRTSPEFASMLGDKRYNDQVSDNSDAARIADVRETKRFLERFQAIDDAAFSEQEKLNKELMIRDLKDGLESYESREWEMPVNQMSGIHLFAAQFPSFLGFTTVKDYDDYITRMKKFPVTMDQTIASMRKGMRDKLMPPKFLLEKVTGQAQKIADQQPEQSPFALPLQKIPDSISEADRGRIRADFLAAIRTSVLPAYAKFAKFVRDEYAPAGRTEVGMWSLPDGIKRYNRRIRRSTTTNMTADEIHQLGLREVARIEGEMLLIAKKLGYSDLPSFYKAVDQNPDLRAKSREQIVELYRKYTNQMYARLPELFGRLPKAKLEIVPMESFREASAAGADYNDGAPDGSRPGRVNVNTSDPQSRKTITMESTAYHEGVPGHHMQVSIAQELGDLPDFRKQAGYTAYVEGWALYSERLGKEVGFYQDPYSDFGRLNDEMLRAIRLVVDSGLHAKHWTREQVVQFFHDHSAIDEVEVQNETDRYIVWPGQALGYKVGQLKILELRERAKQALGDRFDIRQFHDEVLGAGALPMDVLEERIDAWIAAKKKA
ncbi:MAG TPA: DUF885 domain-containing protein [Thermoanaerobaculia bacterium]|nr:DUF885 domain-containing protein [Thermoanaerobaculia bacterium]